MSYPSGYGQTYTTGTTYTSGTTYPGQTYTTGATYPGQTYATGAVLPGQYTGTQYGQPSACPPIGTQYGQPSACPPIQGYGGHHGYQGYGQKTYNYNFGQNHISQYGQQIFRKYDRNNSGTLTKDEFYSAMGELAQLAGIGQFSPNDINELFNTVDYDRNGHITYGEYRNLLEVLANIRPKPIMGQTASWRSTSYY